MPTTKTGTASPSPARAEAIRSNAPPAPTAASVPVETPTRMSSLLVSGSSTRICHRSGIFSVSPNFPEIEVPSITRW